MNFIFYYTYRWLYFNVSANEAITVRCYVTQGVSPVTLHKSVYVVCPCWLSLSLFCLCLCQHENGESSGKDPEPKPPSNPARKFVRLMCTTLSFVSFFFFLLCSRCGTDLMQTNNSFLVKLKVIDPTHGNESAAEERNRVAEQLISNQ